MLEEIPCQCGDTGSHYLPEENQYEANCWECYLRIQSHNTSLIGPISPSEMDYEMMQSDVQPEFRDCTPSSDDLPF